MEPKEMMLRYAIKDYYGELNIEQEEYLIILSKITGDTPKQIELFINGHTGYFLLESKLMICFHLKLGYHFLDLRAPYCRRVKQEAYKKQLLQKKEDKKRRLENKKQNKEISDLRFSGKPKPEISFTSLFRKCLGLE